MSKWEKSPDAERIRAALESAFGDWEGALLALGRMEAELERVTAERDELRVEVAAQKYRAEAHLKKWVESNAAKAEARVARLEVENQELRDASEVDDATVRRLEAALREIADGMWNTGTGKNLSARQFAREALGSGQEKPHG